MPSARPQDNPHYEHRWLILGIIAIAQLMVVLDATIVNIALPSAQKDLGFADDSRQWIVTAYALAFGSLLLLGGRLGDLFGRKWAFIGGLLGFAVASAVGGAAGSFGVLVTARAAQGMFGALLAPSALALLSTIFVDPAERGKAFGIYGAIAGGGAAVGLLLGGILTEILSWRWCLYVNLLFAVPAAVAALRFLHNETHPARPPLDLVGTVLATSGLFALVYGFSNSEMESWGHPVTVIMLSAAAVLLVLFVIVERREEHPLLPPRVVADRTRGGAFMAIFISGIAMFGVFLFLTYFLQQTKGFTPIQAGLAFLPMTAAIMITATSVNIRFLNVVGPRPLLVLGMTLGAIALVWLAQISPDSSYAGHVLPALIVFGVGLGNVFAPAFATATYGVDARDSGVASATVNTMQQVGGSIGTALLSSIFASAVASYAEGRPPSPRVIAEAAVHGYTVAFWVAAGVFAFGAVTVGLMMRSIKVEQPGGEPAMAQSS
jgi:EmrB/QacA subfamily drug resistance transporter